jgi:hypothetical protein
MRCETCGNDLHQLAEVCWRCSSVTAHGHKMEVERQVEAQRQAELQAIDASLRAEYDRHTHITETGRVNSLGDPDIYLNWENDVADDDVPRASGRKAKLIRSLREFVGEEPEPAVFPSAAKRLFGNLIILFVVIIAAIWTLVAYFTDPITAKHASTDELPWLILFIAFVVSVVAINQILTVRKFGRTKRELRRRRREAGERHNAERKSM